MENNHNKIIIERDDSTFGAVLNCAVRYCIGRQTYMPALVIDKIKPMLPLLSNQTLWCFCRDIEGAPSLGSPIIDEPNWKHFLADVKEEIAKRKETST